MSEHIKLKKRIVKYSFFFDMQTNFHSEKWKAKDHSFFLGGKKKKPETKEPAYKNSWHNMTEIPIIGF